MKPVPENTRIELSYEPLAPHDRGLCVVEQASLVCFLWQNIPVMTRQKEELPVLDRFMLMLGLKLVSFTLLDAQEITGLSTPICARITRRLRRAGLVATIDDHVYMIQEDAARTAIAENTTVSITTRPVSFLFFPRLDELIALTSDKIISKTLSKTKPCASVPVPDRVKGQKIRDFLEERIKQNKVVNLSDNIVGVDSTAPDVCILDKCPAYAIEAAIGMENDHCALTLLLADHSQKNRPIVFPEFPALTMYWRSLIGILNNQESGAILC